MFRQISVMCLVVVCLAGHARAQTARSLGVHDVLIEGTVRAPDGGEEPS